MTGWAATNTLREKADLFVRPGFRDEDGIWHDGPHRIEFDAALALVETALDAAADLESRVVEGPEFDLGELFNAAGRLAAALRAVREGDEGKPPPPRDPGKQGVW